ncbi:MAG TPA: cell division protein FtsA [Rhodospirillaceae bacterium]|nr:MAG: cell division protein FtsA [Alphaproteobacteria bacterium GWF2_58_20]HAU30007.1 cell division protein FtsA [Rhodospirillaceae bacterium]
MTRQKTKHRSMGNLVAALDVGSTKIACLIARVEAGGTIRIVGVGHQVSRGIRNGMIADMDAARGAIAHAVETAESMAGESILSVIAGISGQHLQSHTIGVEMAIGGREITDADAQRILSQGSASFEESGQERILHTIPVSYKLDGSTTVRDPRGMFAQMLAIDLHAITAANSAFRNLTTCIGHCHLDTDALCASPLAAGLSCLTDDEKELGCTVIDMGGGTTSFAMFLEDQPIHIECLPIGGSHVTSDIARGLATPIAHAERLKILYGSALPAAMDDGELIDVPQVGEENGETVNRVQRSLLNKIIQPRLEETLEMVRSHLDASGLSKTVGRQVVLTGGASQLPGVREMAKNILEKQVRLGRPIKLEGLPEALSGPAFATTTGLLVHLVRSIGDFPVSQGSSEPPSSLVGRAFGWLRENI